MDDYSELQNIDLLLCPGDLSNQIDPQGIFSGWQSLHEIAQIFGAPPLVATIGNHDIDSHQKHAIARDDPLFFGKNLSARFPCRIAEANQQYWNQGFHTIDVGGVFILNINTMHTFNRTPDCKRGGVTDVQRQQIAQHLKKTSTTNPKICLCHHHPIAHEEHKAGNEDLMDQGSLLVDLLIENGFHLVIHGHKHHARLRSAAGTKGTIPVLASGSFSAVLTNELAQFSKNIFHIIDIDSSGLGQVFSWKFRLTEGWTPADWSSSNIPHRAGFGYHGEIPALAETVLQFIQKRSPQMADWQTIVRKFPHIQNMLPGQLLNLGDELLKKKVQVLPKPPDTPEMIGVQFGKTYSRK